MPSGLRPAKLAAVQAPLPAAVTRSGTACASAPWIRSTTRWQVLVRRSYRENAQGRPEVDADPLIREPLKDSAANTPLLWTLWGALRQVPILAIRGANSDVLNSSTLERMEGEKPGLATLTVANRGYPPLLDEPECVAAIDSFLAAPG